ncbi:uncharacterized protein LOC118280178 [Spodoptera frugiperda]|uniref:Uncharacterized protein LOC118280178 n=1 Tax=Spodoptera frugiperda TaxID=7108 RepID=A0A9R0F2H9_SPOFR|nr:uncharacterized protein LOC118280178 [Spodoptera frugiperda]
MTRCDYDAVFYRVFCISLLAIAFTFTVILTNVFIDIDGLLASKKEPNTLHMTRCDYDAVFYRVFCISLLAIAFTFTVILTNVFIDIDGLLASKKDKHNTHINDNIIHDEFTPEATDINEEINYGENDESYRTKRSVETQSFLFHIKNPKVKNILANKLSSLLEELDAEETADTKLKEKLAKEIAKTTEAPVLTTVAPKLSIKEDEKKKKDDELLHLTMHNILLQGIIGHLDLNDVYKRVYSLISNFNDLQQKKDGLRQNPNEKSNNNPESRILPKPVEAKFFDEMLNCNELQEQIVESATVKEENKKPVKAKPNVMIKTIIDISSPAKDNDTKSSKDNVKGVIELVYNGKTIKFTRPDITETLQPSLPKSLQPVIQPKVSQPRTVTPETTTAKVNNDYNLVPKMYLNKFIEEYFKRYPKDNLKDSNNDAKDHFETKRFKRHVKIKYDGYPKKILEKPVEKAEDDDLYVEIETHFDSKGLKGEKKKKLIRNIIEKIQKAIHTDMKGTLITPKREPNKMRRLHFKKRLQDPLDHKSNHVLVNKYSLPLKNLFHRQLNPISKTVPMQESSPYIGSRSGEEWKKPCFGPHFLAANKAINSAELSQVDIDYSKILDINGVPQRLQQPLNTEASEENLNTNSFYDVGKMKFFIKDIDGSGFSVGFNQYVDEPPDPDTMRLFTGLENVIKTYHQTYDPVPEGPQASTTTEANIKPEIIPMPTRNVEHNIERRSVNKNHDYHSNEYKIIYDNNFMPYRNYRDIFESNKIQPRSKLAFTSQKRLKLPLVVDENVFDKNLKPAEIFGLASLFERKKRAINMNKRSINIKKISNLKNKIKLNRFLNTNAMPTKRIYLNKKRNKRQINKIRIIATDLPHMSKHSDENVFVVSDENVFADRAIVKDMETSEGEHDKQEDSDYLPYQNEDSMPSTYITKIFDGRSRHNPLMSKYPHVFMEEISRSREEYIPHNSLLFGKIPGLSTLRQSFEMEKTDEKGDGEHITTTNTTDAHNNAKDEELVNSLIPPPNRANYKVTVKIMPKNQTGLNSGFKEVHTSINKRYNKNGLLYSSLVNVSEISKIIKLNRTKEEMEADMRHGGQVQLRVLGPHDNFMAKRMKEQQAKMSFLLKQHAKHINEQLTRLNEEKINLESLLTNDNITEIKYADYDDTNPKPYLPNTPVKRAPDSIEEEPKEEVTTTTQKPRTVKTTATTAAPTTTTATTHHSLQQHLFTEKIKKNIINTIERNGNLTDQILRKIDKNTEILQIFLRKLTERIQVTTPAPITPKVVRYAEPFKVDWTNQADHFNQNIIGKRNDSQISIPFVYAYQQPIMPHKINTPVASVVYHGHIHTNTIHAKDIHVEKEKIKLEANNQSRFFIDELENDYKVIPVGDVKKNRDFITNLVNSNNTILT